jgi:predicted lipoprotein with Yx(FWY)xxD motif
MTGVAQRRGYAIIVLLAAVALAAWLVQARLGSPPRKTTPTGAKAPAAGQIAAPVPNDPANGTGGPAPGNAAGAAAPVGFVTTALTGTKVPKMGDVVQDSKGWTIYRFDKDVKGSGKSACNAECATNWPAIIVADADLTKIEITGVDKNLVTTVARDDGGIQLAVGGWPAYRFAGDKPGKWLGQAMGNVWFVMKPTGAKNLTCLPSTPPTLPAAAPAAADPAAQPAGAGY